MCCADGQEYKILSQQHNIYQAECRGVTCPAMEKGHKVYFKTIE